MLAVFKKGHTAAVGNRVTESTRERSAQSVNEYCLKTEKMFASCFLSVSFSLSTKIVDISDLEKDTGAHLLKASDGLAGLYCKCSAPPREDG